VLSLKRIREKGLSTILLWDLFMILVALVNLGLIVFDMTYLWLRPDYFLHARSVTEVYDPVKGIEPHPVTQDYLDLVDRLAQTASAARTEPVRAKLETLAHEMVRDDPFLASDQTTKLIRAMHRTRELADEERVRAELGPEASDEEVFIHFWSLHPAGLQERYRSFNQQVRPYLAMCYKRQRALSGAYVDHFLWLDLPFLLFFLVEFGVRWALAVRRQHHPRWFVFPLYNWYEVLGLIPLVQFRIFRLFRIVSIYLRLRRSELTRIGDDFISRRIRRYSDIITEEVSDRVAVHILSEIQDEVRSGASLDIIQSALAANQHEIKAVVLESVRRTLSDPVVMDNLAGLVQKGLEEASTQYESLKMVPGFIKETLTRDIGLAVFRALVLSLSRPMPNARGKDALEDVLDQVLDDILRRLSDQNTAHLFHDIVIQVLENTKQAVAKKKWLEKYPRKKKR